MGIDSSVFIWKEIAFGFAVCSGNTWGDNCQEQCNCQDDQETCNHVDGSCHSGCTRGYEGTSCNIGKINFRMFWILWQGKYQLWQSRNCPCQPWHLLFMIYVYHNHGDGTTGSLILAITLYQIDFHHGLRKNEITRPVVYLLLSSRSNKSYERCLWAEYFVDVGIGANVPIWTKVVFALVACDGNSWGDHCQERCNCQNHMETCNHIDGSCLSGCRMGYEGIGCNLGEECAQHTDGLVQDCSKPCALAIKLMLCCAKLLIQSPSDSSLVSY